MVSFLMGIFGQKLTNMPQLFMTGRNVSSNTNDNTFEHSENSRATSYVEKLQCMPKFRKCNNN